MFISNIAVVYNILYFILFMWCYLIVFIVFNLLTVQRFGPVIVFIKGSINKVGLNNFVA